MSLNEEERLKARRTPASVPQYEALKNRLIGQLDSLIPYIALSHEDVFHPLRDKASLWFVESPDALPSAYAQYRRQVVHSALLLGYAYFEDFLAELLDIILHLRPEMLGRGKQLKYQEIISAGSYDAIIDEMVRREVKTLFFEGMAERLEKLASRYNFGITDDDKDFLCRVSLVRNCIMHNGGRASNELAAYDGFTEEEEFEVTAAELHSQGLRLRDLVRRLVENASANHDPSVIAGQSHKKSGR